MYSGSLLLARFTGKRSGVERSSYCTTVCLRNLFFTAGWLFPLCGIQYKRRGVLAQLRGLSAAGLRRLQRGFRVLFEGDTDKPERRQHTGKLATTQSEIEAARTETEWSLGGIGGVGPTGRYCLENHPVSFEMAD